MKVNLYAFEEIIFFNKSVCKRSFNLFDFYVPNLKKKFCVYLHISMEIKATVDINIPGILSKSLHLNFLFF